MTKADIAEKLYEKLPDLPKSECADFVDLVFTLMKQTLASGEELKITRFGKFSLRDKKPRRGRNPKTGEEMTISRRRVVTFSVSPAFKYAVNDSDQ